MPTQTIPLRTPGRQPPRLRLLLALLPGTLLLFIIDLAGKALESLGLYLRAHHHYFPHVEYVLWGIILGLNLFTLFTLFTLP